MRALKLLNRTSFLPRPEVRSIGTPLAPFEHLVRAPGVHVRAPATGHSWTVEEHPFLEVIMSISRLTIATAIATLSFTGAPLAQDKPAQEKPAGAALEKTANPELVGDLAKEIGATPQQAEGAAGSLFSLAKSRLQPADWTKVASAVPGMDGLLKAAPALAAGTSGAAGGLSAAAGAAGGLASAASAFSKLGLKPDMVSKAVPVLTNYVTKTGGADVGKLLAGALK